jgi:hypothetical protein
VSGSEREGVCVRERKSEWVLSPSGSSSGDFFQHLLHSTRLHAAHFSSLEANDVTMVAT